MEHSQHPVAAGGYSAVDQDVQKESSTCSQKVVWNAPTAPTCHQLGVFYGDAEPRNILFVPSTGSIMLIDFERFAISSSSASCIHELESTGLKRKRGTGHKIREDDYAKELQSAVNFAERWLFKVSVRG